MANPLSNFLGNTQQTNLIKTILSKGVQPRTMVLNYMKMTNNNNPIFSQLIDMVEKGDTENFEKIARDCFLNNGMDYDNIKQQVIENFK